MGGTWKKAQRKTLEAKWDICKSLLRPECSISHGFWHKFSQISQFFYIFHPCGGDLFPLESTSTRPLCDLPQLTFRWNVSVLQLSTKSGTVRTSPIWLQDVAPGGANSRRDNDRDAPSPTPRGRRQPTGLYRPRSLCFSADSP